MANKDNVVTNSLLVQNRAYFDSAVMEALKFARSGLCEQAMQWAQLAAETAWLMHPGCFTHPPLEEALRTLGEKLKEKPAADVPSLPVRKFGAKTWLHILTTANMVGGHTRLAERMIVKVSAGHDDQHSILLIEQGVHPVPSWLSDAAETTGGALVRLPGGLSLETKALVVRKIAYEWADRVVLHVHPNDPVAPIAFAISGGPPVIFVNHADHVFWLGAGCIDVVADIRPEGQNITIARRGGLPSMIVPIPLDTPVSGITPAEARNLLDIPTDTVVLVVIASSYKLVPYGELDFPATVAKLLQKHSNALLLVVGPTETDPHWQDALALTGGRIRLLGTQTEIDRYYAAADICLESFPLGSLTATLDAMLRGMPVIRAPLGALPTFGLSDYNGFGEPPANSEEFLRRASACIDDPFLRKKNGETQRRAVTETHTGPGWLAAWHRLEANLPQSHAKRQIVLDNRWNTVTDFDVIWSEYLERHSEVSPNKELFFKHGVRQLIKNYSRGDIFSLFIGALLQGNWKVARILFRDITKLPKNNEKQP